MITVARNLKYIRNSQYKFCTVYKYLCQKNVAMKMKPFMTETSLGEKLYCKQLGRKSDLLP